MYKALYTFKKTHPTSLGFDENEEFLELPGAAGDKNWYYVVNFGGIAGYIPRNYVQRKEVDLDQFKKHVQAVKDRIQVSELLPRARGELLAKVDRSRINFEKTLPIPAAFLANVVVQQSQPPQPPQRASSPQINQVSGSSSRSSTPPKSLKKRAAPLPPAINNVKSTSNSPRTGSPIDDLNAIQTVHEHSKKQQQQQQQHQKPTATPAHVQQQVVRQNSHPRRPSIPDPNEEQIRTNARELIETVRNQTGLSYQVAQNTIHTVLSYVSTNFSRLDRNVPALLCELEQSSCELLKEPHDVAMSSDSKALESLFEELTRCKEDDQQRNWMLYEDESRIRDMLNHVCDRLQNAPRAASLHILKRFKYFYVNNLIEYFQMESRWPLRRPLVEAFILMCSLDPNIISIMLSSVLPLELVQDLYQTKDLERLRTDSLLLTVIFSRGEPMPVHYFDQIGRSFVDFLIDYIEEPPNRDFEVEVADVYLGVLLSYNLQFNEISSNVMVQTLSRRSSVKAFMEKILLLLNREEDPTVIVEGEYADPETNIHRRPGDVHATQKIIMDIFKHRDCHKLFYTNDLYVLIDIIVRQLSDLSPEDSCRALYIDMCELVLRHSDYDEHLHRYKDLEHCFLRIVEEEDSKDRRTVTNICKEIDAFSSLVL